MKRIAMLLLCCAGALSTLAHGQSAPVYPNKFIRLIIPSAAGGFQDSIARIVAPGWIELLGQQIVIDFRAGAGGLIGTEIVAKGAPDGYTLLFGLSGPLVIVPFLNDATPYDTLKDFAPVSLAVSAPYVLLVHPGVPATSVKDLIALAKSRPGVLNYASGGSGTGIHLAAELLKLQAGVNIVHVPYKSGPPAMTALMAGEVQAMFVALQQAAPHMKSERVRALAVGGAKRSPLFPDLPTVSESGFKFNTSGWYGVLAPRGTPRPIVDKLNATLLRALTAPQVKERLLESTVEVIGSTPEEFAAFLREEMATWSRVIKAAGLKGQ